MGAARAPRCCPSPTCWARHCSWPPTRCAWRAGRRGRRWRVSGALLGLQLCSMGACMHIMPCRSFAPSLSWPLPPPLCASPPSRSRGLDAGGAGAGGLCALCLCGARGLGCAGRHAAAPVPGHQRRAAAVGGPRRGRDLGRAAQRGRQRRRGSGCPGGHHPGGASGGRRHVTRHRRAGRVAVRAARRRSRGAPHVGGQGGESGASGVQVLPAGLFIALGAPHACAAVFCVPSPLALLRGWPPNSSSHPPPPSPLLQICDNVVRHRLTLQLRIGRTWQRCKDWLHAAALAPLRLLAELFKWVAVMFRWG